MPTQPLYETAPRRATAHANWPFDITLFSAQQRDDSVDARVTAPSHRSRVVGRVPEKEHGHRRTRHRQRIWRHRGDDRSQGLSATAFESSTARRRSSRAASRSLGSTATITGGVGVSGLDSNRIAITAHSNDHDTVAVTGSIVNLARLNKQEPSFNLDAHRRHDPRVQPAHRSPTCTSRRRSRSISSATRRARCSRARSRRSRRDLPVRSRSRAQARRRNASQKTPARAPRRARLFTDSDERPRDSGACRSRSARMFACKSSEADVRLTGQLELVKSNTSTRLITPGGEFVPGLTLNGSLTHDRRDVHAAIPQAVQRAVQRAAGRSRDVRRQLARNAARRHQAQYTVRRQRDRDLNVIVNLTGRLPTPQISFSSDNDYTLEHVRPAQLSDHRAAGLRFHEQRRRAWRLRLADGERVLVANGLRNTPIGSFVAVVPVGVRHVRQRGQCERVQSVERVLIGICEAHRWTSACRSRYKNLFLGLNAGYLPDRLSARLQGVGVKVEYRFRPDMSLSAGVRPGGSRYATELHQHADRTRAVAGAVQLRRSKDVALLIKSVVVIANPASRNGRRLAELARGAHLRGATSTVI